MSFDKDEYTARTSRGTPPSNPSFVLKASVQTYELSVPDLQKLIAEKLCVPEERITITTRQKVVSSDPMDRYPEVYGFDGLTITVKNT